MVLICSPANGYVPSGFKKGSRRNVRVSRYGWCTSNPKQTSVKFYTSCGFLDPISFFPIFISSMKLIFQNLFFPSCIYWISLILPLNGARMQGHNVPCPAPRAVLGHTPAHTGGVPSKYPELRAECGRNNLLSNIVYKCSVL